MGHVATLHPCSTSRADASLTACAFKREYDPEKEKTSPEVKGAWSIAGTITRIGTQLEDKYERIKGSSSESDAEQGLEGVRIHLHGGKLDGRPAKMIASLVCDKDAKLASRANEDDDDSDEEKGSETSKPEFVSYGPEPIPGDKNDGIHYVLRIRWKTEHACEGSASKGKSSDQGSWGFFTWLIIM